MSKIQSPNAGRKRTYNNSAQPCDGHYRSAEECDEDRRIASFPLVETDETREDDASWPKKNIVGRQELEVRVDKEHISFEVSCCCLAN